MFGMVGLLISLLMIVLIAELFCNALEQFGAILRISDGVTGSIFAAVGTALPETIIPILTIMGNDKNTSEHHQIGIGSILGAPLMLSTLSFFVMALSVLKQRGINGKVKPNFNGVNRDLQFFIFCYALAFITIFLQALPTHQVINGIIVIVLGVSYFIYILVIFRDSIKEAKKGNVTYAEGKLFLERLGIPCNIISVGVQFIIALLALIYTADYFIACITEVSHNYGVSSFVLSLLIVPIATELPEKVNSIIWIRKKKDTLAIANITGAMVFQGSLLPMLGIAFLGWNVASRSLIAGMLLTFIASLWLLYNSRRGDLRVWHFFVNGILYALNLLAILNL